jgi:hypothetical protein
MEKQSNLAVDSTDRSPPWSWKRRIALVLIVVPFIVALPIRHWALHYAGSWFVSTRIEPEDRLIWLALGYLGLMCSIAVVSHFIAAILLMRDQCFPTTSIIAAILYGVFLLPAVRFLWIFVKCYIQYG